MFPLASATPRLHVPLCALRSDGRLVPKFSDPAALTIAGVLELQRYIDETREAMINGSPMSSSTEAFVVRMLTPDTCGPLLKVLRSADPQPRKVNREAANLLRRVIVSGLDLPSFATKQRLAIAKYFVPPRSRRPRDLSPEEWTIHGELIQRARLGAFARRKPIDLEVIDRLAVLPVSLGRARTGRLRAAARAVAIREAGGASPATPGRQGPA